MLLTEISFQEAKKVFGISGNYSLDDLKKKYKQLAMKHHPDRGGSLSMMKKINVAYDVLRKQVGKQNSQDDVAVSQSGEQATNLAREFGKKINELFDTQKFIEYFENLFGEKFDVEVEKNENRYYINTKYRFHNAKNSKVFTVYFSIYISDFYKYLDDQTAIGYDATTAPFSLAMDAYIEGRKYKMRQREFTIAKDVSLLTNPEKIFPKSKLLKDKSKSKLKRADAISFVEKELKGKRIDKDTYMVEAPTGYWKFQREVFMRQPAWYITGPYKKEGYRYIPKENMIDRFNEQDRDIFYQKEDERFIKVSRIVKAANSVEKIKKQVRNA